MSTDANVPHLAIPFRIERNGSAAVIEQDTVDDVAQCVEVLLSTVEGERIELPSYGVPDYLFKVNFNIPAIMGQIEQWEPRAAVLVSDAPDRLDDMIRTLTVRTTSRRQA